MSAAVTRLRVCGAFLVALTCLPTLAGCASHIPVSETTMFTRWRNGIRPAPVGVGAVVTTSVTGSEDVREAFEAGQPEGLYSSVDLANPQRRGGGMVVVVDDGLNAAAASVTFGLNVFGFDVTAPVWERVHGTASVSSGGFEAVVQRPIYDGRYAGFALGLGFRRERYTFAVCEASRDSCPFIPEFETFGVNVVGARAIALMRPGDARGPLYGSASVGYAPAFDRLVVNVGVAVVYF